MALRRVNLFLFLFINHVFSSLQSKERKYFFLFFYVKKK